MDIEKIKESIESCLTRVDCKGCSYTPFESYNCRNKLLKDCLDLVKEVKKSWKARAYMKLRVENKELRKTISELEAKDKLNQLDIDNLQKKLEKDVEEKYQEFMSDYRLMKDEFNASTEEAVTYRRKAIFYYKLAKSYGVECISDNVLDELIKAGVTSEV